jgi:hypothetical protein
MKMTATEQLRIANRFRSDYRELLAFFTDVDESLISFIQLNHAAASLAALDGPGYRGLLESTLVQVIDNGALVPVSGLNEPADADLVKLRRSTGIGVEQLPAPPPPPLTAQQLLDQRVTADWNNLKIADFKRNCANDKSYRQTFDRLSAEDKLGGLSVTAVTDGTAAWR